MVALLPSRTQGYSYYDREKQRRVRVRRKNADEFDLDGFCFYRPFPLKELSIKDLVIFMAKCLSLWDYAYLGSGSHLAVSLIGRTSICYPDDIFKHYTRRSSLLCASNHNPVNYYADRQPPFYMICNTILVTRISKKT